MQVNQIVITRDGAEALEKAETMEGAVMEYSAALDLYVVYAKHYTLSENSDSLTFRREYKKRVCYKIGF